MGNRRLGPVTGPLAGPFWRWLPRPIPRGGVRVAGRRLANTLLCQFAVQKVEPVLSPEEFVAIDVRGGAEDLPVDRFLR